MAGSLAAAAFATFEPALADEPSLRQLAAQKGLLYGCAASSNFLAADAPFAALVAEQAGILVPERELKQYVVQKKEGAWDFSGAEALAAFAAKNGQKFRGHTLVWASALPPWLEQKLGDNPSESLLTDMIARECGQFRGRVHSWDVVNEAVVPGFFHPDGLQTSSPWYRAFGESYIATAFHAAREADPHALLFYNDYSVEMRESWQGGRRTAILNLLEKLKKQGVPIDGFGVQGHLKPFLEHFDEEIFAAFLRDIAGLGLKIMITELDATDHPGPADPAQRDVAIASLTRRFLDVSLDNSATIGVLTWGLSDRYSWLSMDPSRKWPDGQLSRGLPYDGDLKPKPMREAIAAAFKARKAVGQ
jgi:endo-1,4-beta-xylanase